MSTDEGLSANTSVEMDQDSDSNIKADINTNSDSNIGASGSSLNSRPTTNPKSNPSSDSCQSNNVNTNSPLNPSLISANNSSASSAANNAAASQQPSSLAINKNNILEAKEEFDSSAPDAVVRNPSEDLFSTKRWGVTPIRQDTPWELPPSPTQTNSSGPVSNPPGPISNSAPIVPPGISQTGDSFRSSGPVNDFHAPTMVNNFGAAGDSMGANGLANSLGHMHLGGAGMLHSSRFDQPWRSPVVSKPHQSSMAPSSPFANHNLINSAPGGMQKSMLNSGSGNGGGGGGSSSFVGMQQGGGEFARAPGPASSMMDNNMTPKPFGMANRSSTWSAFGAPAPNEPEAEWPKSTASGISASNSTQPTNAFDLVPEFEPGKPWRGSMLMKSVEDDPTMTPGSMARSLAPQRKTIWSDDLI